VVRRFSWQDCQLTVSCKFISAMHPVSGYTGPSPLPARLQRIIKSSGERAPSRTKYQTKLDLAAEMVEQLQKQRRTSTLAGGDEG